MLINLRNALMAGKRTPTAKDYVQDGLVAMWDGTENAGWGVHDQNATTWKNLVQSKWDFILDPAASWNSDSLYSPGNINLGQIAESPSSLDYADFIVMEVVFKWDGTYFHANKVVILFSVGRGKPAGKGFLWEDGSSKKVFSASTKRAAYTYSGAKSCPVSEISPNVVYSVSAEFSPSIYVGTQSLRVDNVLKTDTSYPSRDFTNGMCLGGPANYSLHGSFYNIRIYSRALTAAEIAANYAIDKARFDLPDASTAIKGQARSPTATT